MNSSQSIPTPVLPVALSAELAIDAPAEAVWRVLADQERDPTWRRDVTEMRSDPPGLVTVGARTREVIRVGGRTYRNEAVIDAVDPGTCFAWHTTAGAVAHGSRTVVPEGDHRCRVTLALHVRPQGLDRVLAPVLRPLLARSLRRDLRTLAATVGAAPSAVAA